MSLARFHEAQAEVWPAPVDELRAGRKRTHWMWFVFPQLRGLGRSGTARFYGLDGVAEARAYADDLVLGQRLRKAAEASLEADGVAEDVFGPVDALKLRSCATLFRAAGVEGWPQAVLDRFYGGSGDPATEAILKG